MDSVEGEDPSLAFMDSIEEDFFPVAKIARSKSKGRREIMNLVSSSTTAMQVHPLGLGKGRLTCGSGDHFLRVRV